MAFSISFGLYGLTKIQFSRCLNKEGAHNPLVKVKITGLPQANA